MIGDRARVGQDVIGGEEGMLDGFQNVLPNGGDILVSEESATYRPEMEWLAAQLNLHRTSNLEHPTSKWRVVPAENYEPQPGHDVYRFFELFDLPNIPKIEVLLRSAAEGKVRLTPPLKPFLEEKMWFALFWLKPLRQFWRRELGDKYFLKLQQVIPYTWLLDPTPLPQHAVIPRLEIHDWREASKFSQKERDLLLKVSGFSPLSWGSRGVALGADLPHRIAQANGEHRLARIFQDIDHLLRRGFQEQALAVGEQVVIGSGADGLHQALAEFLLQETNHHADALQREAAPSQVANDSHFGGVVQ